MREKHTSDFRFFFCGYGFKITKETIIGLFEGFLAWFGRLRSEIPSYSGRCSMMMHMLNPPAEGFDNDIVIRDGAMLVSVF